MTLADLQSLAHALVDFLPRYAQEGADLLCGDLLQLINEQVIEHNDNLYVFEDEDELLDIAMKFFTLPAHIGAAMLVSQTLPAMHLGMPDYNRLLRDIRNSLLAKDANTHRRLIELFSRHFPGPCAMAEPYLFILELPDNSWLQKLPDELLSFCLKFLMPRQILKLQPLDSLLGIALPKFNQLLNFAQYTVIDALILQGQFQKVRELLPDNNGDAVQTRLAWLDFMQGNQANAIAIFSTTLDNIRHSYSQSDYYFNAITGLFFILALIKQDSQAALYNAMNYALLGSENPLWGRIHAKFHDYLSMAIYGFNDAPEADIDKPEQAFAKFFGIILDYWSAPYNFNQEKSVELQKLREQAVQNRYDYIVAECDELQARLDATWIPGKPSPVDFWKTTGTQSILDCHPILPVWEMKINELSGLLAQDPQAKTSRIAWFLEPAPAPAYIKLKLIEQQLTKTGKWGRGHLVNQDKLLQDIHGSQWPRHYTVQDIQIITMMNDLKTLNALQPQNNFESNFNREAPLALLAGHPYLFWSENDNYIPIHCEQATPYTCYKASQPLLQLTMYPENPALKRIIPVHEDTNSLKLYAFSSAHLNIARTLSPTFSLPLEAEANIKDLTNTIVRETPILSYVPLDFLPYPTQLAEPTPLMNLEYSNGAMKVELRFKPFKQLDHYNDSDMNLEEYLPLCTSSPVRIIRNRQQEEEYTSQIKNLCSILDTQHETAPATWTITDHTESLDLLIKLHEMANFVTIRWKKPNKKLSVTRRLGLSDLHIIAHKAKDWFTLDGEVVVDEELSIKLQKLLVLVSEQKGNYITLDTGQIIALSNDFRRRLEDVNSLGILKDGTFQLNQFAVPAAQQLLEDEKSTFIKPDEWLEQAARINHAMSLKAELPRGMSPNLVLRKYQMDGYQWLMRLDAWGAGACLADDMGLGKTIQAITFILAHASEGPTLVVAPTTVCHNWLTECEKFAPQLQLLVFGQGNRQEMLSKMGPGMLMVITYGLLQSEVESIQKIHWRTVVLDEAQAIKNYQAKRSQAALKLDAQFRFVTTGTPLENNLNELWTLFEFITPGLLGSRLQFQNNYSVPIERNGDTAVAERLNRLVKPFLLRRRKEQVLTELPPKTEIPYLVELSDQERAFYEAVRRQLMNDLQQEDKQGQPRNESQERIRILAAITKLRQAACNPRLINPSSDVPSAKQEIFKQLVQDLLAAGHTALVFSQFVKHLAIIRSLLDEQKISYQYLDGSTPTEERTTAINAFQEGHSDLFLISLKAGGQGLNLTRADFVIILDPWWNPAVEDQASDRAHRIGQTRPVTIYRLIARNTIEEKIIALHHDKRDLTEKILSGADTPDIISAEELLRLITES